MMQCAADMLLHFRPNLLMVHPANIDAYRHQTGIFSPQVTHGVHEISLWLAQLFKAADDAGILDSTDFFIVSDHGQVNITRESALNVLLRDNGLIKTDEEGNLMDYTAYAHSGGASALVYLKDPKKGSALRKTESVLKKAMEQGECGIDMVLTEQECREKYRLGGEFSFAVEGDGHTLFVNACQGPLLRPVEGAFGSPFKGNHGHLPRKGPQPTLIAFGPHVRPGAVLPMARLVDEAPTFARVLGFDLPGCDGRVLEDLLMEE